MFCNPVPFTVGFYPPCTSLPPLLFFPAQIASAHFTILFFSIKCSSASHSDKMHLPPQTQNLLDVPVGSCQLNLQPLL